MEALLDSNTLTTWILQYGGLALFILLTLGILALPVPEETLMVLCGILMQKGNLNIPSTVIAAYLGAMCGISMSYLLGRTAGHYVLAKYGKWIGLTHKRLEKVHTWFERFGKWTLFIGYFIPGIRHFTGFVAGTSDLTYRQFALYAYSGAFFWVSMFLSIGYFFGSRCLAFFARYKEIDLGFDRLTWVVVGVIIGVVIYVIYKARQHKKRHH